MYNCICGGLYRESEKAKNLISNRHRESLPRYRDTIHGWRMILAQRFIKKIHRRHDAKYGKRLDGDDGEESYDEDLAEILKNSDGGCTYDDAG